MNTPGFLRTISLALLFGAALSAQAVDIGLSSVGHYDYGNNPFEITGAVLLQQGGYGALDSLSVTFDPGTGDGSGTYTGAGGTLSFDIDFDDSLSDFNLNSLVLTWTWMATGGSGTYMGATGTGTIANSSQTNPALTAVDAFTVFRGDVEAVP
ncbi:hypothetical protein EON82_22330, partial [bacterium]